MEQTRTGLKYHYIKDDIVSGEIIVENMSSSDRAADVLKNGSAGDQIREANDAVQLIDVKALQRAA